MAALLGNLVYAGQQTLLTTQPNLGAVNAAANLYSINTGALQNLDVSHFTPAFLAQGIAASGVGSVGVGGCTLPPLLFTRTGTTVVYYNPNTTALPGELSALYFHSRGR